MTALTLYFHPLASFCWKVLVPLYENETPFEPVLVDKANAESLARFAWDPFMHNTKLKGRLHRIKVPTRIIWGEHDGIVKPAYGKAYAAAIPGAVMQTIPGAGHYPQLEQPEAFMTALREFLR